EVELVVCSVAAEGEREREGLSLAACAAYPLLVVKALRRHVRHHDGAQRADVDADLHRRSDAEHVDPLDELDLVGRPEERALETPLAGALFGQRLRLAG